MTTGASSDIEHATRLARAMITQYGMSGSLGMVQLESLHNPYLGATPVRNHSEATAAKVDSEVRDIIGDCHRQATELLTKHRAGLDAIAGVLIDKESLDADEFAELFKTHVTDTEESKGEISE